MFFVFLLVYLVYLLMLIKQQIKFVKKIPTSRYILLCCTKKTVKRQFFFQIVND